MKKIEAIVRPDKLNDVLDALENMGVDGITTSEIRGHGRQKGHKETSSEQEYHTELLPKVKIEAVVDDSQVDQTITTVLEAAETGQIGDGKIFIEPVEQAIRIRSRETGEIAL